MKVYRISNARYIQDLSGTGAKLHGGRWNPKGYALLYTSENKSLAALEVLVHLNRDTPPQALQLATIILPPNSLETFTDEAFTTIIESKNANTRFKQSGLDWITASTSLGLKVPSILINGEFNILINPTHPRFKEVKIDHIEDFTFDQRFFV